MEGLTNLLKRMYRGLFGTYRLSSLLCKEFEDEWKILDVACGRSSALTGVGCKKKIYTVGLDFYEPYISKSKKLSIIHNEYILGDARILTSIFKPKSFDCAIATEVLEHLNNNDGKNDRTNGKNSKKEHYINYSQRFFTNLCWSR